MKNIIELVLDTAMVPLYYNLIKKILYKYILKKKKNYIN